jgi:hypothetical protein
MVKQSKKKFQIEGIAEGLEVQGQVAGWKRNQETNLKGPKFRLRRLHFIKKVTREPLNSSKQRTS